MQVFYRCLSIRQLLAFSRKQTLQPKVINLNTLIRNIQKMLKRIIGEDIDCKTVLTPKLWSIEADPGQIDQVIVNLAANARDAMPNGGIFTFETKNVELDKEYSKKHAGTKPGPHVMLSISDNGIGMSADVKANIFEPFFTTNREGKGTGLGLSTVFGIIKQSGGHIWAYSEIERGTSFKIYFPKVDSEAEEIPSDIKIKEIPRGSERILLVEDEDSLRTFTSEVLKRSGYKVLEAKNGGEAYLIYKKQENPIELVITDVIMPQMGGVELAENLHKINSDLKILYISGYSENAIVHFGVLDPDKKYLPKPFKAKDLLLMVREVLDE